MIDSRVKHRGKRTTINIKEYNSYPLETMFNERNIREQLKNTDRRKLSIRDLDCNQIQTSLQAFDTIFINLLKSHHAN